MIPYSDRTRSTWTRRRFSQAVAACTASVLLERPMAAFSASELTGLGFVASEDGGTIQTYRVVGAKWQPTGSYSTPAPAQLALHPTLPLLYAVNAVALWKHLPRGSLTTFRIDPARGAIQQLHTQPLSLGAINPRHIALSPHGDLLLVTSVQTGIYNLLPLAFDGIPQPPRAVRKELCTIAFPAVFHPTDGTLLTSNGIFRITPEALVLHRSLQAEMRHSAIAFADASLPHKTLLAVESGCGDAIPIAFNETITPAAAARGARFENKPSAILFRPDRERGSHKA